MGKMVCADFSQLFAHFGLSGLRTNSLLAHEPQNSLVIDPKTEFSLELDRNPPISIAFVRSLIDCLDVLHALLIEVWLSQPKHRRIRTSPSLRILPCGGRSSDIALRELHFLQFCRLFF